MAGGNNHAKQIVIDDAEGLAKDLQNGHAGCAQTQGRAISLIVKMLVPMYKAEFVTVDQCKKMHEERKPTGKMTKLKIGPISVEGPVTATLLLNSIPLVCCVGFFYIIGKLQSWW